MSTLLLEASAMFWLLVARAPAKPLIVEPTDVGVRVRAQDRVVAEYVRKGVPFKPYVVRLATPSGTNVLRDNVPDHPHHHGLMFAVRVSDVNFWEEVPPCGTEESTHLRLLKSAWEDTLMWRKSDSAAPLMTETRRVEIVPSSDPQATLLCWRTTLAAPSNATEPVKLTGAHYHGLGMRFVEAMDGGTFETADNAPGTVFRGEESLKSGHWCSYHASVDGQAVTAVMFDHPDNPRPVTWFTMARPFSYLSATMRYHETPVLLAPHKPMTLRYGVAVCDGNLDRDRVEKLYRAWLSRAGRGK
jgi:hypothetical protein